MKKMYILLILAALSLAFVTPEFSKTCMAAETFKPVTLKFANSVPQPSWFGQQHQWWANEVEKRTGGKVKVQIFWMESLVKWKDMLPGVQSGIADLGWVASTYHPSNLPLYLMLDNNFNLPDQDTVASILALIETVEKEPQLKAEMEREKVILLCPQIGGSYSLIGTRKCFGSIKDLKGKTIRTYGGARTQYYQYLGMNPVFLPYSDLYEAIDRSTIDAIGDMGFMFSDVFKHYEVVKCVYAENLRAGLASGVVMNLDMFNKFPKDIQDIFVKLKKEYGVRCAQGIKSLEADIIGKWTAKYGVTVKNPSPEDKKIIEESAHKANEYLINKQESAGHTAARKVWDYFLNARKTYVGKQ